jgi:iron(III) transport system ATP-binding protein
MAIVDVGPSPSGLAGSLLRFAESRLPECAPAAVGIRPEALRLGPPPGATWCEEAVVEAVLPAGSSWTVRLRVLDTELYAVSYTPVEAAPGDVVTCWTERMHLFGADGARLAAWDGMGAVA